MMSPRLLLVALFSLAAPASGQEAPDVALDAPARTEIVDGVLARLEAGYVFPEVADAMAAAVRDRDARGEYDGITSARALADSLTAHLRAVSHDKHLGVMVSPRPVPPPSPEADAERQGRQAGMLRYINLGVDRVERLEGNVGLLVLRGFAPADAEGLAEVVAAAMTVLARTDALVIDLRENQGGEPETVRLLASYVFGPEPVHLNSLWWREDDRTDEYWTLEDLGGPRYGADRPVYVLTSDRTFSAAEEFAYNLQTRGRAVVVGETTGGGAHPGDVEWVTDRVGVWVPSGRAINPVTGTNWEGTGVVPDVPVDEADALRTAHVAALRQIAATTETPLHRAEVERVLRSLVGAPAP